MKKTELERLLRVIERPPNKLRINITKTTKAGEVILVICAPHVLVTGDTVEIDLSPDFDQGKIEATLRQKAKQA